MEGPHGLVSGSDEMIVVLITDILCWVTRMCLWIWSLMSCINIADFKPRLITCILLDLVIAFQCPHLQYGVRGKNNICLRTLSVQFSSVQSLSRVQLFVTPWIAARQASLSITNSRNSLRLTSIELVMPSSHLILCHPLLLLPPIPHSIRVFPSESTLCMRWPKYWSFSFSIIPSKEIPGLISFRMDWLDLLATSSFIYLC